MSWPTQAEYDYWSDILADRYSTDEQPAWLLRPTVIRAKQKLAPVRAIPRRPVIEWPTFELPDYGKMFKEMERSVTAQIADAAEKCRALSSLEHVAATLRDGYVRRIDQVLKA